MLPRRPAAPGAVLGAGRNRALPMRQPTKRCCRRRALDGRAPLLGSSATEGSNKQQQQQQQQQAPHAPQQAPHPAQDAAAAATLTPPAAGAAGAPAASPPGADAARAWQRWCHHFEALDEAAAEHARLRVRLGHAVASEAFPVAAALRERLDELEAGDAVARVRGALTAALASEDYAAAARLRDEGFTGLAGWWAGTGEDDPFGHLLHVAPEYGRWTGRAYTARDLCELAGGLDEVLPLGMAAAARDAAGARLAGGGLVAGGGGGGGGGGGPRAEGLGTPLLEVFVREAEAAVAAGGGGGGGEAPLETCAVALRVAAGEGAAGDAAESGVVVSAVIADDASGRQWALTLLVGPGQRVLMRRFTPAPSSPFWSRDGDDDGRAAAAAAAAAAALAPPPPPTPSASTLSRFDAQELDEVRRTLAELASGCEGGDGAADAAAGAPQPPQPSRPLARDAGVLLSSVAGHLGSAAAGEAALRRALESGAASGRPGAEDGAADSDAEALTAAELGTSGMPDEDGDLEVVGGGLGEAALRGGGAGGGARELPSSWSDGEEEAEEASGREEVVELQRCPSEVTMVGRDRFILHVAPTVAGGCSGVEAAGATAPAAPPPPPTAAAAAPADPAALAALAEVEVSLLKQGDLLPPGARVARLHGGARVATPQEFARIAAAAPAAVAATSGDAFAAQLAQVAARGGGVAGGPDAASPSLDEAGGGGGGDGALASLLSGRMFTYSRLNTRHPRTDPFSGLYIGAFGRHGSELLQLKRGVDEAGEEVVIGTKLTGDANVPAGVVSFRARVGRRHRLPVEDLYPADLGVVARLPGEGRVAAPGYVNARWVDGELLQFGGGNNPLVANAQLGFVWAVPGSKRFLILLNRVELE